MIGWISDTGFEIETNEEYEKIKAIAKDEKYKDILKYCNGNFFYKDITKEKVEELLNTKINEEDEFSLYVSYFDGGGYIRIGVLEITIGECIEELQEKLEQYEDRIWNSQNIESEISKILKEQVKIVFEKRMKDEQEKIDRLVNGEINWR